MAEKNVYRYRYHGKEVVILHYSDKVPDFFKYEAESAFTVAYIATPEAIEYIKNNNVEQCGLGYECECNVFPKNPDTVEDIDLYIDDDNGGEIFYTVDFYKYTREEIDMAYNILDDLKWQVRQYHKNRRKTWCIPKLDHYNLTNSFCCIDLKLHNFIKDDEDYTDEYKIECVKRIIFDICVPVHSCIEEGESIEDYALVFDEDKFDAIFNAPKYYDPS